MLWGWLWLMVIQPRETIIYQLPTIRISQLGCVMALTARLLLHQLLHVYYYCRCIMLHILTVHEKTSGNWIFCNFGCRMDSLWASGYCRYGLPKGGYCKGELSLLMSIFCFWVSYFFHVQKTMLFLGWS